MRILWNRVFALCLAIGVFLLLLTHCGGIVLAVQTVDDIGPTYSSQEQIRGLVTLGLLLVALVAIVKLLLDNNRPR